MKLLFTILLFAPFCSFSQAGFLDKTFSNNGKRSIYSNGLCYATAIQADGKILVGGYGSHDSYLGQMIIRLLPDGSIDKSFGDNGFVVFPGSGIYDLKIESDKKIVAMGGTILARFNEDGHFDSSFGLNGMAYYNLHAFAYSMEVQPDGKYILAGYKYENFNKNIFVFRV